MKKLIIFGESDIAELACFYFENDSNYSVKVFCVDKAYRSKDTLMNKEVVDFENIERLYPPTEYDFFVALAYTGMNKLRESKVRQAIEKGYKVASYISSKATTFIDFNCGYNCFILEDNTIQPFVKIGQNVTLWSGNHIGHHSIIEDNVFLTSHVVVSGGVTIGKNSFIGVNSTLRDHINIGEATLIAAGSLVNKDTVSEGVYMGSPAKHKEGIRSVDLKI